MSQVAGDANSRVIDLWGFLKGLWTERLTWLGVFVVVLLACGAVWARSPAPPVYEVTQTVVFSLPRADNSVEAIQQLTAPPNETSLLVFSRELLRPPVTDAVLESHPEFTTLAELQERVWATPIGNTMEVRSNGNDPVAEAKLVSDLSTSFLEQLPVLTKANPPALRYEATVWSDPTIIPIEGGGRAVSLLSAITLAGLVATVAAAVRGSRHRR